MTVVWAGTAALVAIATTAPQVADTVPLFAADEPVTVTLVADLEAIRERLYRGWCFAGVDTEALVRTFADRRDAVETLFRDCRPLG